MDCVTPPRESFQSHLKSALNTMTLKAIHWKVWFLSAMGIFMDGYDLFIISVVLPLLIKEFHLSPLVQGAVASAAIVGMIFGATIGGRLTDRFGRKSIYILDLVIFIVFTLASAFATEISLLILFRFLLGLGIGADYPICASYVSEFMPVRLRGKMLIGAFIFQAIGIITAAITGLFILELTPEETAWRWMLASGAVPAILVLIFRLRVFESPLWQLAHGKIKEAIHSISQLTGIGEEKLDELYRTTPFEPIVNHMGFLELFKPKYIRQTILSSIPWFLMDIATYAVGIFTPIILAAIVHEHPVQSIATIFSSVAGAAFLDIFLVIGLLFNIFLIEKWGRIKLQTIGFAGMAFGLILLVIASRDYPQPTNPLFVFAGFIVFNLLMNMGPNATTFTIPAEVFPTKLRATGHGFAAGCAKVGAFIGIFFLPILQESLGLLTTLLLLALISMLGLFFTVTFRIETQGKALP